MEMPEKPAEPANFFTAEELQKLTDKWPKVWKGELSAQELGLSINDIPKFMNTLAAMSMKLNELNALAYVPMAISLNDLPPFKITWSRVVGCMLRHKFGPARITWDDIIALDGKDAMNVDLIEGKKGLQFWLVNPSAQGVIHGRD